MFTTGRIYLMGRGARGLLPALLLSLLVCASAQAGNVAMWGSSEHAQLGRGDKVRTSVPVMAHVPSTAVASMTGGMWGGALLADGTLWTWGGNEGGQACNGTMDAIKLVPSRVDGIADIDEISGSGEHWLALVDGRVFTCGANTRGQQGIGTEGPRKTAIVTRPTEVPGIDTAKAVMTAGANSYALLADGTVLCWGEDTKGQCGDTDKANKTRPILVAGLEHVRSIAAGGANASGGSLYAVLDDGTVRALGLNNHGQLGDGNTANSNVPVKVLGLAGVVKVVANSDHAMALLADGELRAWGEDSYGQLGAPAHHNCGGKLRPVPCAREAQRVPFFNVANMAAGVHFSIVLAGDGKLYGFGQNRYKTVGDGTQVDKPTPVLVAGDLRGVTGMAAGYFNASAITSTVTPAISRRRHR